MWPEKRGPRREESRPGFERGGDALGISPGFFLGDSGNSEESEQGALQSGFAAGGVRTILAGSALRRRCRPRRWKWLRYPKKAGCWRLWKSVRCAIDWRQISSAARRAASSAESAGNSRPDGCPAVRLSILACLSNGSRADIIRRERRGDAFSKRGFEAHEFVFAPERMSTFRRASWGMEFTEVPPSTWPML